MRNEKVYSVRTTDSGKIFTRGINMSVFVNELERERKREKGCCVFGPANACLPMCLHGQKKQ